MERKAHLARKVPREEPFSTHRYHEETSGIDEKDIATRSYGRGEVSRSTAGERQ